MNFLIPVPGREDAAAFPQHSLVRLVRDLDTPDGVVPSGTPGVVLEVFEGGRAYLVEFDDDHEPPEFVRPEWLVSGQG
jgi:hypothetical protein